MDQEGILEDYSLKTSAELNMPVDGHIPHSTSVEHVIGSGQKMIAHSEEFMNFTEDYSHENILSLSSSLKEGNIWLTPTLITSHNLIRLLETPEKQFTKKGVEHLHPMGVDLGNYIYENLYKPIPEARQQYIKTGYETFQVPFVNAFQSMGGKLLTGSDVLIPPNLPGYALHEELEELVNAGLTPFEALRASTTNPHEFLEESDQAGTIEPGKMASLVLLSSNPLENISNTRGIEGVIYKGRWISRDEIDSRLEEIAASYTDLSKLKRGEQ
jgi:imidazolonepropionase-like amidohydrolase